MCFTERLKESRERGRGWRGRERVAWEQSLCGREAEQKTTSQDDDDGLKSQAQLPSDRANTLPPLPVTIYNIIHLLLPLCLQSQEIWYTSVGEGHGYLAWCEVEVEVKVTPELL